MNFTTGSNSNPWSHFKTRYVLVLGGVALAASITVGGAGALKLSGKTTNVDAPSLLPERVESVRPMFGTAADAEAEQKVRWLVQDIEAVRPPTVQPMFGTAAEADYATQSLAPVFQMLGSQMVSTSRDIAADADYATHSFAPVFQMPLPQP